MGHELKFSDQPKILHTIFLLKTYSDTLGKSKFESREISVHPIDIM